MALNLDMEKNFEETGEIINGIKVYKLKKDTEK